jgi:outer membrane protein insertion porin family
MQRPIFLFLAATLLLAASIPVPAQKFLPKTIQFTGDPEYSNQELMAAADLKKGVVLNVDEMKSHSKILMDTGVFDTLSYTFNGQDLVYKLVPSPTLFPIRLENLPLAPGKELDAKLHDRFPLYHGKVSSAGTLLESVRGALQEMLATQGIKVTVTATPFGTPGTKNVTAMKFTIESPPVLVGTIQLDGVSQEMQSRVRSVVDRQKGEPFETENTEKKLERILYTLYVEEGYAAVKVHANRSDVPVVASDAIAVPFSVVVQEGRLYKLGTIHLPPSSLVSQEEIDKAISGYGNTAAKGQILSYTLFQIVSRYKSKGYLDCAVKTQPEFDEVAGTVSYRVDIDPGPVYHLAFVKFENVSDDLRRLLMRSWQMLPGDPFDESYVSNFLVNAQKDDPALLRTLATVKPIYEVRADPQTHDVNVIIRLEKRP